MQAVEAAAAATPDKVSEWRKRTACVTCRNSKIRCEFSSTRACNACEKKGIKCVAAPSGRAGDVQAKKPARYAWLGTRSAMTAEEKRVKARHLNKAIADGHRELEKLGGDRCQASCVETMLDMGLLTADDAVYHFSHYKGELEHFLPVENLLVDFQDAQRATPISTMAAIICSVITLGNTTQVGDMVKFFERTCSEAAFRSKSVDVINALIIGSVYIRSTTEQSQIPNYTVMAMSCTITMGIGNPAEIDEFKRDPQNNEELRMRFRAYVALYLMSFGMVARTEHSLVASMMPRHNLIQRVLSEHTTSPIDKFVATYVRLYEFSCLGVEEVAADPNSDETLDKALNRVEDLSKEAQEILSFNIDVLNVPFYTSLLSMTCCMREVALNSRIFDGELDKVKDLGLKIVTDAKRVIDLTLSLSNGKPHMPQWFYFRPLQSVTALLRIRIIFWSLGYAYDVGVEDYYQKIKDAWKRNHQTRIILDRLNNLLIQIDQWMQIRFAKGANVPASTLLHFYIRDVVLGNTSDVMNEKLRAELKNRADFEASKSDATPENDGSDQDDNNNRQQVETTTRVTSWGQGQPQQPQHDWGDDALNAIGPKPTNHPHMQSTTKTATTGIAHSGTNGLSDDPELLLKQLFSDSIYEYN